MKSNLTKVKRHSRTLKGNPWAICHASVGPKKTAKFERCVRDVKVKEAYYRIHDTSPDTSDDAYEAVIRQRVNRLMFDKNWPRSRAENKVMRDILAYDRKIRK